MFRPVAAAVETCSSTSAQISDILWRLGRFRFRCIDTLVGSVAVSRALPPRIVRFYNF